MEVQGHAGEFTARLARSVPGGHVAGVEREEVGFEIPTAGVTTVAQWRVFDREGLFDFLRTQAVMASGLAPTDDGFEPFLIAISDPVEELRRHDGTYDQTSVRLHVRCRRPD